MGKGRAKKYRTLEGVTVRGNPFAKKSPIMGKIDLQGTGPGSRINKCFFFTFLDSFKDKWYNIFDRCKKLSTAEKRTISAERY